MPDHELIQAYTQQGSERAFADLVRRYLDLVYSTARRQVRAPHLAEEVTQNVFIDVPGEIEPLLEEAVADSTLSQAPDSSGVFEAIPPRRCEDSLSVARLELPEVERAVPPHCAIRIRVFGSMLFDVAQRARSARCTSISGTQR